MRYGDGAVQWMTAGRGMLHEEMWDVEKDNNEFELYQLWVNLPSGDKFTAPKCQLLTPAGAPSAAAVEREGSLSDVRRAEIPILEQDGGKTTVRLLAGELDGVRGAAETFSPLLLAHVELRGRGTARTLAVPVGWSCFAYVRRGRIHAAPGHEVGMYETRLHTADPLFCSRARLSRGYTQATYARIWATSGAPAPREPGACLD